MAPLQTWSKYPIGGGNKEQTKQEAECNFSIPIRWIGSDGNETIDEEQQ